MSVYERLKKRWEQNNEMMTTGPGISMPPDVLADRERRKQMKYDGRTKEGKAFFERMMRRRAVKEWQKASVVESKNSELYFDTYSAAINHALTTTRKQFDIDPEDVADIVGLKSRRPSRGKTTSVSIPLYRRGTDKLDKKQLHIQVYNRETDRDPFELNFYVR